MLDNEEEECGDVGTTTLLVSIEPCKEASKIICLAFAHTRNDSSLFNFCSSFKPKHKFISRPLRTTGFLCLWQCICCGNSDFTAISQCVFVLVMFCIILVFFC